MDIENLQLKVLTLMKENIDKDNRIRELEQKLVCIKQLINLTACARCSPGFESAWKSIDILSGNPESFDPKPEENQTPCIKNGNKDQNVTSPTLELDSDSEEPEDNLEPSQTPPLENINIDLTDALSFEKYKKDFIDSKNPAQLPSPKEKSKFFCTYTKEQLKWLHSRFEYGQFLGRGEARRVAPVLNLSVRQVTNWFSNQRRKIYLAKTKDDNKLSDLPTLLPDVNDVSKVKKENPKIQLPEFSSQKEDNAESGEINPTEFIQEKTSSFTPEALEELRDRFARNPYLLSGEAEFFAAKFSLTKRQITNWFSNNRRSNGLLQSKKIFDQISSLETLKETDISLPSLDKSYEPPVKIAKI